MEKAKQSINKSPYLKDLPDERKNAIAEFVKFIRETQETYHVHGHGVETEKDAQNIEKHGLYTAWKSLVDFSRALHTNEQLLAEKVVHWDYEGRRYIVLIAVPKHPDYLATDAADEINNGWENRRRSTTFAAEHVFEPAEKPEGVRVPLNADKRIPPSKIIGYWDDKESKLHINPQWQRSEAPQN